MAPQRQPPVSEEGIGSLLSGFARAYFSRGFPSHKITSMTAIQNRRAMLVLIVLSGLIISICMGLRQSLGLFMRPMTLELGISAATFGFSIAGQNLVLGLSPPLLGALGDRYGPRPVLIATALLYAAGLLLMVFSNAFPGGLEVAGFLAGVRTAGTGFGALIATRA